MDDFLRDVRAHAERLQATGRPVVLTRNGDAALVVQDSEAYRKLLDRIDELETLVALGEASEEVDREEGSPIEEVEGRLRSRLGIE